MPLVYDHVTFDLDGTLVDSRADLVASVNHVLRSLGLPELPRATVCAYIGEGVRRLMQRALGRLHQDQLDPAFELFLTYYGAHLLDETRPYPGIVDTLAAMADRGLWLSVLTNKPAALSRTILDGLGLLPHFVAVIGGDSLPARKPDPAGVRYLLGLTRTRRERMLLVGDSTIDLHTARAAGIAFCGVAWGLAPQSLRAEAVQHFVEHPGSLLAILEPT